MMYSSINHTGGDKMDDGPTIKVHVYYGGRLSKQHDNFSSSKKLVKKKWEGKFRFQYEEKNVDEVKHWTPAVLVTWLLNCDIHLVMCHPHQGMKQTLSTTLPARSASCFLLSFLFGLIGLGFDRGLVHL
jgi:hypothetical protein